MEGQRHTSELKPCPFCGCQPEFNRLQFIRCSNKECIMRDVSGMVASHWNTRAESGLVKELATALDDAVDSLKYVQTAHPEATGRGVRAERIQKAEAVLDRYKAKPAAEAV